MIRRREFIATFGATAMAAWPLAARAQQSAMPVVGFLRVTSQADSLNLVTAFRHGLREAGFVEGQNYHRIPLGGRSERSASGAGRRFGPSSGSRDRRPQQRGAGS